jgi:hypothetical protein
MNFDDLLRRYFADADLAKVEPGALAVGVERMQVDLGLARDPGQRFGLWAVLHMLGAAPDLDVAFKDESERDAARNFMDMADRLSEG